MNFLTLTDIPIVLINLALVAVICTPLVLAFFGLFALRLLSRMADAHEAQSYQRNASRETPTLDKKAPENWPAHEISTSTFGR